MKQFSVLFLLLAALFALNTVNAQVADTGLEGVASPPAVRGGGPVLEPLKKNKEPKPSKKGGKKKYDVV